MKNSFLRKVALLSIAVLVILPRCYANDDKVVVEAVRVSLDPHSQVGPSIYGDNIVWRDTRNGPPNIYLYKVNAKKETRLTTASGQHWPVIYGDKVVYEDLRIGDIGISLYDLTAQKETRVSQNPRAAQNAAYIYDDKIVWCFHDRDDKGGLGYAQIYLYDITKQQVTQITRGSYDHQQPSIFKNKILWVDSRNGTRQDIYMYDINTQEETSIIHGNDQLGGPIMDGDVVVWEDPRNDHVHFNIYMYNLRTGEETRVTKNSGVASYKPAIYGDKIVYADNRGGSPNIYLYHIPTKQEIPITQGTKAGGHMYVRPKIYQDTIVWEDNYQEGGRTRQSIYMATVSFP